MIPALANHLWQSTLFAGAAGLLAWLLSKNQARVRYALWLAASVKFLVPFSLLVAVGSHTHWSTLAPIARPAISIAAQQISEPFAPVSYRIAASSVALHRTSLLPAVLLAVWAVGFLLICCLWFGRWRRIRANVRTAAPLPFDVGIPVLSSPELLEPGVFGILHPVLLLPVGIGNRMTVPQFRAILAHELCHVRWRDNLASAFHMAVEAIFWFHPLVWWIGAHLVEERECACDEEVLRCGNEPEVYAETILKTCRFYLESPLLCMSGITGADLKARIVRIMTGHARQELSFSRRFLLAAAGVAAVAGPVLFGILNAPPGQAQTASANGTPAPKFEVASIKPSSGDPGLFRVGLQPSGRFTGSVTVKFLLELAYGLKDSQISGGPGWIDSERYDIEAKPDEAFAAEKLSRDERFQQVRLMMQALLADRFQLTLRHETKELPVYALVVAKNGPKLKESAPEPPGSNSEEPSPPPRPGGPPGRGGMQMMPGQLTGNAIPMERLADVLSRMTGRIVVDKTGLKGSYDLTLKWTPGEGEGPMLRGGPGGPPPPDAPPPPDPNGPTIFVAVQEQLGLKLEAQKSPVDTVVIEHVERPSAN